MFWFSFALTQGQKGWLRCDRKLPLPQRSFNTASFLLPLLPPCYFVWETNFLLGYLSSYICGIRSSVYVATFLPSWTWEFFKDTFQLLAFPNGFVHWKGENGMSPSCVTWFWDLALLAYSYSLFSLTSFIFSPSKGLKAHERYSLCSDRSNGACRVLRLLRWLFWRLIPRSFRVFLVGSHIFVCIGFDAALLNCWAHWMDDLQVSFLITVSALHCDIVYQIFSKFLFNNWFVVMYMKVFQWLSPSAGYRCAQSQTWVRFLTYSDTAEGVLF